MALISTTTYDVPAPGANLYSTRREVIGKFTENASGVRIGEFVKYRYHVTWGYNAMAGTDYQATVAALEGTGAALLAGTSVIFFDTETGTYLTRTMLLEPPIKQLYQSSPLTYSDVRFELIEQ